MLSLTAWWRRRQSEKRCAHALYQACCAHARREDFYRAAIVPDDVQGRFEMLVVHLWLVMRHLRRVGDLSLSERLAAVFFSDMDAAMRESGVGDMAVPRRVKTVAQAFYGRLKTYDQAIARTDLEIALSRNLSGNIKSEGVSGAISALTAYLLASDALMAQSSPSQIRAASAIFAKYSFNL